MRRVLELGPTPATTSGHESLEALIYPWVERLVPSTLYGSGTRHTIQPDDTALELNGAMGLGHSDMFTLHIQTCGMPLSLLQLLLVFLFLLLFFLLLLLLLLVLRCCRGGDGGGGGAGASAVVRLVVALGLWRWRRWCQGVGGGGGGDGSGGGDGC